MSSRTISFKKKILVHVGATLAVQAVLALGECGPSSGRFYTFKTTLLIYN